MYHCKHEGKAKLDIAGTSNQVKVDCFTKKLDTNMNKNRQKPQSATERWENYRDSIYEAAISTFGKKTSKSNDWFAAYADELQPLIDAKRQALVAYKS
jgi:hypothetical protein